MLRPPNGSPAATRLATATASLMGATTERLMITDSAMPTPVSPNINTRLIQVARSPARVAAACCSYASFDICSDSSRTRRDGSRSTPCTALSPTAESKLAA